MGLGGLEKAFSPRILEEIIFSESVFETCHFLHVPMKYHNLVSRHKKRCIMETAVCDI